MSLSGAFSSKKSTTEQNSQTDPWEPAIPQLKEFLSKLGATGKDAGTLSPTQTGALDQLAANAQTGNPYTGDLDNLTKDLFGTTSRAGDVTAGYDDLERRLRPTADGENVSRFMDDPQLTALLQRTGDDVMARINSQFAGAGRDLSGANQTSVARGVSAAQLPILVNQLNAEKARSDAAARSLFEAKGSSVTGANASDQLTAQLRAAGIEVGEKAVDARDQGAQQSLAVETARKQLPYEELQWLAQLLFPAAGLGQQSQGTATTNSSGWSLGAKDVDAAKGASTLAKFIFGG